MRVVVLQRNANAPELDDKSRQHLSFMKELADTISPYPNVKVLTADEASFQYDADMNADNTLVVVAGSQGNQKAMALKDSNTAIPIVGLMNCLNQTLVEHVYVDSMVLPGAFCSEQKEEEERLLETLKESSTNLLMIEQDQSHFPTVDAVKEIATALAAHYQWQSTFEKDDAPTLKKPEESEEALTQTLSRWGTNVSSAMFETYRNYPITTKVLAGLGAASMFAYAGSKTEMGKSALQSASEAVGLSSGSNACARR